MVPVQNKLVVLRGGGDIATGIAHRLKRCGFHVIILEILNPTVIRRTVSFAEAIYEREVVVEGIRSKYIDNINQVQDTLKKGLIPVIVDPEGKYISQLKPDIVVDAIIAKVNKGTTKDMAPLVIGIGPGFIAGVDV